MTAIKNFSSDEKDTFANLKKKLLSHYKPSMNTSTYKHTFYNMYQKKGEQVEDLLEEEDLRTRFKHLYVTVV